MTLRALRVIAPIRSGSPAAAPVYLPFVTTMVLPSVVVHVRLDVLEPVAVNVPATAFALFAPPIPSATAYPVATSATSSAARYVNLRMEFLQFVLRSITHTFVAGRALPARAT